MSELPNGGESLSKTMMPGNVKKNKPAQRAQAKTKLLHEKRRRDVTRKDETGHNERLERTN